MHVAHDVAFSMRMSSCISTSTDMMFHGTMVGTHTAVAASIEGLALVMMRVMVVWRLWAAYVDEKSQVQPADVDAMDAGQRC